MKEKKTDIWQHFFVRKEKSGLELMKVGIKDIFFFKLKGKKSNKNSFISKENIGIL